MGAFRQSSLRALAPASLVVFGIVLLIVIVTSLAGGGDSSSSRTDQQVLNQPHKRVLTARQKAARRARRAQRRGYYVVQVGDNLYTVANRTGIPISTLLALNPTVDPQGLVTGQRIRLRAQSGTGATGASGATGATGATGPR